MLAGVNPSHSLYSMIAGTTVAALFTSSVIMNVDSTGATALATFDALGDVAPEDQLGQLVVLSLLVGMFMLVLGFLKLGFLVRFISKSSWFLPAGLVAVASSTGWSVCAAWFHNPLVWLAGDVGDEFEVGVVVQDGEVAGLCYGGNERVDE